MEHWFFSAVHDVSLSGWRCLLIFRCIHWVTEYVRLLQPDALWFRLRGWACKLRHGPALSYWSLLKVLPWDRDEGSQHVETRRVKTEEGACMDTCDIFLSSCKFVLKWLNIELLYYGLLSSLFQLAVGDLPMSEIVLGHKYDIPGLVEYASPVATWIEVLGWSGRKDCQNAAAESHRTVGHCRWKGCKLCGLIPIFYSKVCTGYLKIWRAGCWKRCISSQKNWLRQPAACSVRANPVPWWCETCDTWSDAEALGNITPDNCVGQVRILRVWHPAPRCVHVVSTWNLEMLRPMPTTSD